jgi:hypothetical protein
MQLSSWRRRAVAAFDRSVVDCADLYFTTGATAFQAQQNAKSINFKRLKLGFTHVTMSLAH